MVNPIIEFINVSKRYGNNQVLSPINLAVYPGEFLTLLGPSGCGKTTLLRLVSGFEAPSTGSLSIAGKDMKGVSPQARQVHTVFQNYALFPHMTVFENVAFGLQCRKVSKADIHLQVQEILQIVKLEEYADRYPDQLSGGQQQRVAIARAVVNRPVVLLLDEPLSSLDYRLRKAMQLELKQLQRRLGIAFVFVTHDQEEALTLSDRVVVMDRGKIEQIGTPRDVYEEPQNLHVAKFIGEVNVFDTEIIAREANNITVEIQNKKITLPNRKDFSQGEKIHVLVRPEDLHVWGQNEVEDTTNMLPAVVEEVIYKGTTVDLMVRLNDKQLLAATEFFDEDDEKLEYTIGEAVWLDWFPGWEVILPYEK